MKKITKKQIMSLGYERGYRKAYLKGKREALHDLIPLIRVYLEKHQIMSTSVGDYSNWTDNPVEILVLIKK